AAKDARALRFYGPTDNLAFGIFYIEIDLAVRIGPDEFGDAAGDGDRVVGIVGGIAVVRLERGANEEKRYQDGEVRHQPKFHSATFVTIKRVQSDPLRST